VFGRVHGAIRSLVMNFVNTSRSAAAPGSW
jgi:hypothetical protein